MERQVVRTRRNLNTEYGQNYKIVSLDTDTESLTKVEVEWIRRLPQCITSIENMIQETESKHQSILKDIQESISNIKMKHEQSVKEIMVEKSAIKTNTKRIKRK